MGPPANIQTCPVLSKSISIHTADGEIATVERLPRTVVPISLQMLPAIGVFDPGPFYLDYVGVEPCLYPISSTRSDANPLAPNKILAPQFQGKEAYFGIPTLLRPESRDKVPTGVIYDPRSQSFYAPDRAGLQWYLIGNLDNYASFIDAAVGHAQDLYLAWQAKPVSFFNLLLASSPSYVSPSKYLPAEAQRLIKIFSEWLKKNDPELHSAVADRLTFASAPPRDACLEKNEDLYAFFEPESGKISLLPPVIDFIKKRRFGEAAQIVAHEWAHLRSSQAGLVSPSLELHSQSVQRFYQAVAEDSWLGALLVGAFGDTLRPRLECAMLPYIPEEEAHAFAEEFAYSASHLDRLGFSGVQLQHEALEGFYGSWEMSNRIFSESWVELSMQYFLNAQSLAPLPHRPGSSVPAIRELFENELLRQAGCSNSDVCWPGSSDQQQLRKLIPIYL